VDFSLSDEQEALAGVARSLSADLFGETVARSALSGDWSGADKGWTALTGAGLTGLMVPAELDGGGGGVLDACVVLTELSAALAPVPYLTSAVAVPALLAACGGAAAEQHLRAIGGGETMSLIVDGDLRWPAAAGGRAFCLDWEPGRSAVTLAGDSPVLLSDVTAAAGIDPLHPIGLLTRVDRPQAGSGFAGSEGGRRALAAMHVASAAALTGCLAGAAQLAWDYIAIREQYGRTLASFQAVRHLAADLLVDLETCRSVTFGAAWMVDNDDIDTAARAAAIAKAWCGQAAVRSVETAIQLLGGIGVTWESAAHLYLRDAHHLSCVFGDTRTLLRELGHEFVQIRGKVPHGFA
jgi:acyl-CoA dehydrogenase